MTKGDGAGDLFTLFSALQLGDSFFPSGLYTLSHGLESFGQAGQVGSPDELERLAEDYVVAVVGTSDAVAAAGAAHAAATGDIATIVAVDRQLLSMKLAHEAAVASCRTGRRLLDLARRLTTHGTVGRYRDEVGSGAAPGNYAVSLGVLASAWGLGPQEAAAVELYSFVTGLLGAALRTLRLDHNQAQRVLVRLRPALATTAGQAARTPYRDMVAFAPAIDIMQMRHTRAEVRLFAS